MSSDSESKSSGSATRPDDETDNRASDPSVGLHTTFTNQPDPNRSYRYAGQCPYCARQIEEEVESRYSEIVCSECEGQFFVFDDDTAVGTRQDPPQLDRYRIDECLGRGGFGVVWKAFDEKLQRDVAVKIPHRSGSDKRQIQQVLREARAAAHLSHPNIVRIHDVGQQDGVVYIVSDLIAGDPLSKWFEQTRPTFDQVVSICKKTCEALQHAHDCGVIHRDLKPSNIMIDESGQPHIMDFGLARREIEDVTVTVAGAIMGTPAYMSPEQAEGRSHEADARSDVYSIGATLFELLTGERPFRGNRHELMNSVIHDEPPSPRKYNRNVPRDLETISLRCLEKKPARRYQSANQVREELTRFESGEPIRARPISRWERARRWCIRRPLVSSLAGFLALSVVAIFVIVTWFAISRYRLSLEREKQARIAGINFLISESRNLMPDYPQRGLLLAVEAVEASRELESLPMPSAVEALRDALADVGGRCLAGHREPISAIAISPDGRWLATGGGDQRVILWDLQSGTPERNNVVLAGHHDTVHRLTFSADGRWLVSGTPRDAKLRLWDLTAEDPSQNPRVLAGHNDYLDSLFASSDGRWLVATYAKSGAQAWDLTAEEPANTGRVVGDLQMPVYAAAMCPRSNCLVLASDELPLVWDLPEENPTATARRLQGNIATINRLVFSPSGRWLAASDFNNQIHVWDMQQAEPQAQLLGRHRALVSDVVFSPDEQWIVSTGNDAQALVWNLGSSDVSSTRVVLDSYPEPILDAAISRDSRWLALASEDHCARLWELESIGSGQRPIELTGHTGAVKSIRFSANGDSVITDAADNTIRVWNLNAPSPSLDVQVLRGYEDRISDMELDRSGRWLATRCGTDNTARLWDLDNLTSRADSVLLHRHASPLQQVTLSPDGQKLAATGDEGAVFVWRFDSNPAEADSPLRLPGHFGEVKRARFGPRSRWLVTQGTDDRTLVWDLNSTDPASSVRTISDHPCRWLFERFQIPTPTAWFDESGRWLFAIRDGHTLCRWDLEVTPWQEAPAELHEFEQQVTHVEMAREDARKMWVVTGGTNGSRLTEIVLHEDALACDVRQISDSNEVVSALIVDESQQILVMIGVNQAVRRWDFEAATPPREIDPSWEHGGSIVAASLDPHQRWLMTSSLDNFVRIHPWAPAENLIAGAIGLAQGNDEPALAQFADDGKRLVTISGASRQVLLWELQNDELPTSPIVLIGNQQHIRDLALSADGEWLVTAGEDGTVRMWNLQLEALLEAAKRIAGRELTPEERSRYALD